MKKKATRRTTKNNTTSIIASILIISIIIIIIIIIVLASSTIRSTGNKETFWDKPNELRVVVGFDIIEDDEKAKTVLHQETTKVGEPDKELKKRIEKLKLGLISFFKEEYQIDVSQKLAELQQINLFSAEEYEGSVLNGYFDKTDNSINLNKDLLEQPEIYLDSVFIHESIHYLGMSVSNDDGMYLIEGLTEALTQQCCKFLNLKVLKESAYEFQKELALQILTVDKELVRKAFSGEENVLQRINKALENVPRKFRECRNPAENLECCINSIFFGTEEGRYIIVFQAQDIVSSYCKTFEPSEQQVKEIREHYVIEDFEELHIFEEGDSFYLDYK